MHAASSPQLIPFPRALVNSAGTTYANGQYAITFANQWTTLQINVAGDGSTKSFTYTNPGTATRLFYRIAVSPTP